MVDLLMVLLAAGISDFPLFGFSCLVSVDVRDCSSFACAMASCWIMIMSSSSVCLGCTTCGEAVVLLSLTLLLLVLVFAAVLGRLRGLGLLSCSSSEDSSSAWFLGRLCV